MTRLRNYFLAGLIVCAPLAITAYLVWSFIQWVDGWVKPYIPLRYNPDNYLPFAVPGFGLIVALLMITLVGFLAANFIGRSIVHSGERMVGRIPLVTNLYGGLKKIFSTVLANRSDLFSRVGLIEWPRRGLWSIVLVPRQQETEINRALEDKVGKTIAVFRPISPNVTTGYIMYVAEEDVIPLNMSIEEAARFLISAGLVAPDEDEVALAGRPIAMDRPANE